MRAIGASTRIRNWATLAGVIDDYLEGEDWETPHADMDLAEAFGAILEELAGLVGDLAEGIAKDGAGSDADPAGKASAARRILVRAPAIVNVLLNYKICAEHGLPFHPTVYYELAEAKRYRLSHPIGKIEEANRLYRQAIGLARSAYRLDPGFPGAARAFGAAMPPELASFVYSGARDKYTWRGTEPALVRRLAEGIRTGGRPDVIVAAAHGSIMPALLLSEYLEAPLYFIRFSMFKRSDDSPIVSIADEAWLAAWKEGYALLFDEDVAGGTTLSRFREKLAPLFSRVRTACVIRHAGASIRPDYVGRIWYD